MNARTSLGGAFLLHSLFLTIYSLVWLPIYAELKRRDLVLRFSQAYVDYMQRTSFLLRK